MEKYPVFSQNLQQQRSEGVKGLQHSEILSPHFCWTIVGMPGTGKTTFLQQLLQNNDFYKDKFDYILVISPSPINIIGIDAECVTNVFKIDWVYERINYLQSLGLMNKNILIIMDDCISGIKKFQNDVLLQDLMFNRRHIIKNCTISLLITTQQFTMLPLRFRGVSDHYTFLSMTPKDLDYLRKELMYSANNKNMQQILEVFQKKHQFIYVRRQPFLLCLNFRPIIQGFTYVATSNEFGSLSENKQKQCIQSQQQDLQYQQVQNQKPQQFAVSNEQIESQQQQKQLFSFKSFK